MNGYTCRMETPAVVSNKFGPTFQQVGAAVWEKWDKHLGKVFEGKEIDLSPV